VGCSVLQCVATNLMRHGNTSRQSLVLLQCVAACCGVWWCDAVCCHESDESWHHFAAVSLEMRMCCNMLQCVAVCCSVLRMLQCVAVCCSVLWCLWR